MKYQTYKEYKYSGVEWLGDIPKHWEASLIKYLSTEVSTGGTPKNLNSFSDDKRVCWFAPGDFKGSEVISDSAKYVTPESCESGDAKLFSGGSVIVIGIGATLGKVGYSPEHFSCNQQVNVIAPNLRIFGMFLMHSLSVQHEQMKQLSNASTIGIMNQEKTKILVIALPPKNEQLNIVNFLDHETAKIDTLIEKQQQLIKLLKEKRQAVISHAITKGLNPNAPMRDSGVEWLAEVPEHWSTTRIGRMCQFISYGFTNPMPSTDDGPYMLTATDIEFGRVKYEEARRTSNKAFKVLLSPKSKPEKGDVLLTKDGTLGRVAVFYGEYETCISQSVALLRLDKKRVFPEFLSMALMGSDYQGKMIFDAGGTTIKHIYISILGKMNFILPTLDEQKEIMERLTIKLGKMDGLITRAEKASGLLKERRTALISAAVTGKIDVRNWERLEEECTE